MHVHAYEYYQGIEQTYTEAMKWYKKAADQGKTDAQVNLGVMYYNGRGTSRDDTKAAK